ncbi:MAG TPA: polysaccharide biosynthesis/export family protein, partial [Vicinamibacterales bacterium]|nr:polysaccharide biosynthesis/export family protein [Vicinamibacterales bacterium]
MTARFRSKSIASTVAALAMAAAVPCFAQAATAGKSAAPKAANAAVSTPSAPIIVPAEYVIGADDVMSVVFWRDKELSADVTVRPDGKISLPLLNEIQAAGLTPAQLKDRIVDEAKKYVEDPTVTVEVKAINSRKVYITGEIRKPGTYPITGTTTVLQLISIAGGLGDYAKPDKITIVRYEGGKQTSFRFNYKE